MTTVYNSNYNAMLAFNAKSNILNKPIENVQTVIETGVDTFISQPNESEKKKKIKKRAIAATSSVLVLGTLTMLLNPRSSVKFSNYIKNLREKIGTKIIYKAVINPAFPAPTYCIQYCCIDIAINRAIPHDIPAFARPTR